MLMAGEAVARYCLEREIPIPFATQPAPERLESPADLAAMYAYRKQFRPTRLSVEAEPHFGLGIPCYTRATSPLRRYSDLLVHQQLRAHLGGGVLLSRAEVSERVGVAETAGANLRRAERLSNQHWKLVYLRDHPGWRGMGTVVEKDGQKATLLIAELALEAKVRLRSDPVLNDLVKLVPRELDLPALTCYFRARD
jgi:exoribonuclease-2